jgi:hypothetical protein
MTRFLVQDALEKIYDTDAREAMWREETGSGCGNLSVTTENT